MGYNLTIGEAEFVYYPEEQYLRIGAVGVEHLDAPDHDKYVGKSNGRSPGYSAWHDFCREAGIHELFYGKGWSRDERRYLECTEGFHREQPLLSNHPGAAPICQADLDYVRAARVRREETNDSRPPGFWDDNGIDNGNDHTLARLLWLEFWMDWAIKNCKIPILANT